MTAFQRLLSDLTRRLDAAAASTSMDGSPLLGENVLADSRRLLDLCDGDDQRLHAQHAVGWLHWFRHQMSAGSMDHSELIRALTMLRPVHRERPDVVPPPVREAFDLSLSVGETADFMDRERLNLRAIAAMGAFERSGDRAQWEEAAAILRRLVAVVPESHPDRPAYLNNLGNSLSAGFGLTRDRTLLDASVEALRAAVRWTPAGHPDEASRHNNLGNVLRQRHDETDSPDGLTQAVEAYRTAIRLSSPKDPGRPGRLINLAGVLQERDDLDEAVGILRGVLADAGPDDPNLPVAAGNCGATLLRRYRRDHDRDDLREAIGHLQRAVDMTRRQHLFFGTHAENLMSALHEEFMITGDTEPLRHAMAVGRRSIEDLDPHRHDRAQRLNNYFVQLYRLFQRSGHTAVLDRAIEVQRSAVDAESRDHKAWGTLRNNLSAALYDRFERTGDEADLREAIAVLDFVVGDSGTDIRSVPYLSNLCGAQLALFRLTRDTAVLDDAVDNARRAVELSDSGHPARPILHNSLGRALRARYSVFHQADDLVQAVAAGRAAVTGARATDSNRATFAVNLGWSLFDLYRLNGDREVLAELIGQCSQATSSLTASPLWRLRAAHLTAVALVESDDWPTALHHYLLAVGLLGHVTARDLHRHDQEHGLSLTAGVATEAVAVALRASTAEHATTLLEQGRTQIFSQQLDTRTDLEELRRVAAPLAERLEAVRGQLAETGRQ